LTGRNKLDSLRAQLHPPHSITSQRIPDFRCSRMQRNRWWQSQHRIAAAAESSRIHPTQTFVERRPVAISLLNALRVHQWAKNFWSLCRFCCRMRNPQKLLTHWWRLVVFGDGIAPTSSTTFSTLKRIAGIRRSACALSAGDLQAITDFSRGLLLLAGFFTAALCPGHFSTGYLSTWGQRLLIRGISSGSN